MLKESKSLASFVNVDESSTVEFAAIAGWDDSNFWVATEGGRVFRQRDGVWQSLGRPECAGNPTIRCLDRDTLIVAGKDFAPDHLSRIDSKGISDLGSLKFTNRSDHTEICPISDDLLYCFRSGWLNEIGTVRWSSGQRTEMPEKKYKEAFVHSLDNTPIKEHPVRSLYFTHTFQQGTAFALSRELQGVLQNRFKLVRFRDGIWYDVADLKHSEEFLPRSIFGAWITGKVEYPIVYLVGAEGWVQVQQIGASRVDQIVAAPQFPTSMELIAVWGVSPEKYWVMDSNGTVWERAGSESRVVVRGLKQNDVVFRAVWVSPTGSVFAITDKQLYRLN